MVYTLVLSSCPPWAKEPRTPCRRREEAGVVCGVGECTLLGNCCLFSVAALPAFLCFCSGRLRVGQSPGLLSLQTSWPLEGQPRRSPQPLSGLIVCGNNSELGNFPLLCSVHHCNWIAVEGCRLELAKGRDSGQSGKVLNTKLPFSSWTSVSSICRVLPIRGAHPSLWYSEFLLGLHHLLGFPSTQG